MTIIQETMLHKILSQIGLNENEINVYLAALELGESTVLPIAEKANIKRTYCYDILADLEKKALVFYVEKNGRRRYYAEDPKVLESMLKNRLKEFSALLPDLRAVYNKSSMKPKMRYFEGIEGVKSIYEEVIKQKPEYIDAIASPLHIEANLGNFFVNYIDKLTTLKIGSRELITAIGKDADYLTNLNRPNQQIKVLPENVKIDTDLMIYNNKIALISYGDNIHAVVIESEGITNMQRVLFELAWANAKQF